MVQSSTITENIVQTTAEYEETSPDKLPSSADKLEAETYHRLTTSNRRLTERLEFEYLWYQVIVEPDREITVRP